MSVREKLRGDVEGYPDVSRYVDDSSTHHCFPIRHLALTVGGGAGRRVDFEPDTAEDRIEATGVKYYFCERGVCTVGERALTAVDDSGSSWLLPYREMGSFGHDVEQSSSSSRVPFRAEERQFRFQLYFLLGGTFHTVSSVDFESEPGDLDVGAITTFVRSKVLRED
ncbi:hypothetical protein [Haloarchaeobius sp. DFWS5]|uniref:hypothetical protein n=1 Tax=Haloarchaeobius sp. DFWS5 TaxID=3446114 RepID=UPI003EB81FBC